MTPIRMLKGQAATTPQQPGAQPPAPSAWKRWLTGAGNAVISGLTSGSVSQFVGVPWKKSLAIAGASVAVSLWKYLQQHQLPDADQ